MWGLCASYVTRGKGLDWGIRTPRLQPLLPLLLLLLLLLLLVLLLQV